MGSRDRLLRQCLRERFVVTLADDQTFEGLLVDVDARVIEMGDAYALSPSGDRVKVDGALYLERSHVLYLQRPRP